jgi:transposase
MSFLDNPIWYDNNKVAKLYSLLKDIKSNYEKLKKTNVNAEKMKINQNIRTSIEALDNL